VVETIRDAATAESRHRQLADDLVICYEGTADLAMQTMREVTKKLQLEVNEDKTPSGRYPRPTGWSMPMPTIGCASGYAESTGSKEKGSVASPTSIFTKT
jgi:hypothetical protein